MKKLLLLMLFVMSFANAQVGIGTPTPASTLDITAANPSGAATTVDGILIPRIDRQRAQGMLLTPTSTLIYVNSIATGAAAGTAVNITSVGFYFFDGTVWQKIQAGAASSDWTILGNTGTLAATNFVGTTDAIDFVTRTNNTEKMRVTSAGNVGIGTTTPSRLLNINSSATTVESSATFTKANALGLVMGMSANPDPFTGGGSALNGKSFIHSNAGVDMQIATTSANNLEFGTNGINRMFINSNGAVGI